MASEKPRVLVIEPFYGGSHKQLIDFLEDGAFAMELYTMPAKKWHWRARTAALHMAEKVAKTDDSAKTLFCSSVLNLAELCALRPDLAAVPNKLLYFHENQLAYPVRAESKKSDRDFQYGYNQILSALVADAVLFNSRFNMESFLGGIDAFFKLQPDHRPEKGTLRSRIEAKSRVMHFPVKLPPDMERFRCGFEEDGERLRIVWPHRWEHDKNPEAFFECLLRLKEEGLRCLNEEI